MDHKDFHKLLSYVTHHLNFARNVCAFDKSINHTFRKSSKLFPTTFLFSHLANLGSVFIAGPDRRSLMKLQ